MESDENFFVEAQVDHLHNFFPDFPKSIIRDVLSRADVNGDIDLASQALLTLTDMNDLPEENEMLPVEYVDDDEFLVVPDQQTFTSDDRLREDDGNSYDSGSDKEVFWSGNELVKETAEAEKRTKPTKSDRQVAGEYKLYYM